LNIGLLTSTNPELRVRLDAKGAAGTTAQPAETEAGTEAAEVAAPKPRPTGNMAPSVGFASLRAALDARIAADVSSGQLSSTDAATVGSTLDAIDGGATAVSTAAFLASRAGYAGPSGDSQPAQIAQNYLATIGRGTLIDRWA
jgi:hypothetical protein